MEPQCCASFSQLDQRHRGRNRHRKRRTLSPSTHRHPFRPPIPRPPTGIACSREQENEIKGRRREGGQRNELEEILESDRRLFFQPALRFHLFYSTNYDTIINPPPWRASRRYSATVTPSGLTWRRARTQTASVKPRRRCTLACLPASHLVMTSSSVTIVR